VRNLVLSAEIFSQWQAPKGLSDVDPERLQTHAQSAAAACKALAGGRASPDDAWLAGLLHDIGYWILVQECPRELASAIELSRNEGLSLVESERRITGATHAEIGAYLLGLWGLPYAIVEAVALHHTPKAVTPHGYDLVGALAVSHSLIDSANAFAIFPALQPDHSLDAAYLASLNAPFDWQSAQTRVANALRPT
jgi:HD-like signal output (HDOD) protein